MKNQKSFSRRLSLLRTADASAEYGQLVSDLCGYQLKLQQALYTEVHAALGITDDAIILASHETYEQRAQLFEHINEVLATRQDRFLSKYASAGYKRKLTSKEEDDIYSQYAEQINEMNKGLQNNSGGNTSSLPSVEEQMLRIEDNTCLKFNLPSIY